jgi:ubiquinone/menaquinone biosynthesis C-methylase UbiE
MTDSADFWNKIAETYARKPVEDPEAFGRKIEITRSRMRPQDVILDIGCGTGSLALRLAPFAAEVHGLDISREMIRIATEKAQTQHVANVRFHVGTFDERFTEFAPATLDGICAYSILHLVDDRAATLARIFRLLKPGGFFISSTVCLRESWVPFAPILTVMRWLGKAPAVSLFTRRTLEAELRDAGFTGISAPDVGAKPMIAFFVAAKPA